MLIYYGMTSPSHSYKGRQPILKLHSNIVQSYSLLSPMGRPHAGVCGIASWRVNIIKLNWQTKFHRKLSNVELDMGDWSKYLIAFNAGKNIHYTNILEMAYGLVLIPHAVLSAGQLADQRILLNQMERTNTFYRKLFYHVNWVMGCYVLWNWPFIVCELLE